MRARLCLMVIVAIVLAGFAAMSIAGGEAVKEKSQTVYHITKAEVIPIGDVPGHVIGIADARGLQFHENGQVATFLNRIWFHYTNGNGAHWANNINTCEDGSTTVTKNEDSTTALPDGLSAFVGKFSYTGGTGRFEGIQGGGTYAGKRLAPLTPGGPADCYSDWSATYTLPPR